MTRRHVGSKSSIHWKYLSPILSCFWMHHFIIKKLVSILTYTMHYPVQLCSNVVIVPCKTHPHSRSYLYKINRAKLRLMTRACAVWCRVGDKSFGMEINLRIHHKEKGVVFGPFNHQKHPNLHVQCPRLHLELHRIPMLVLLLINVGTLF